LDCYAIACWFYRSGRFSACGGRQCSFAFSAAAELGRPALAETALRQLRRPKIASLSAGLGIPKNVQAPLAKIDIRSKTSSPKRKEAYYIVRPYTLKCLR